MFSMVHLLPFCSFFGAATFFAPAAAFAGAGLDAYAGAAGAYFFSSAGAALAAEEN